VHQAVYAPEPPTKRGKDRRDQIIAVATELFHERGFDATGIDDIGAAAGITGPGIYSHFNGRAVSLLEAMTRHALYGEASLG
jgi:AcrR family transcriptional regulator